MLTNISSRTARAFIAALTLAALAPISIASAQSAGTPEPTASELAQARGLSRVFQSVAKRLDQSVVNITQYNERLVRRNFFDTPQRQLLQSGLGSGVIISKEGLVLTNHHVVADAEKLKVKLADGRELDGKVIGSDELTDIAVVKIEGEDFIPAQFADSDKLEVGEWVVAIGSPFGFSSTVTSGIVSAKGRTNVALPTGEEAYQDFIQTDAAINPGNSGGPLLNLEGKIVGINSAIATRTGGYEGIGFAIPSNMARAVMDTIIKNGRVVRGYLGIGLEDIPNEELRKDGLRAGVRVTQVSEDSPAAQAGLKSGDIITEFQDRPADNFKRLRAAIALSSPGTEAKFVYFRDGVKKSAKAELADSEQVLSRVYGVERITNIGATVATLKRDQARQLGYRDVQGVVVQRIDQRGKAAEAELQVGDIIVAVNGKSVASGAEFKEAIEKADLERGARLDVIRRSMRGNLTIGG